MLITTRLRKLEEHMAVAIDAQKVAKIRAFLHATIGDPAAHEAMQEIAEAQFDYGHNDPRTLAIIERCWPPIAAALERAGLRQPR